MQQPIEIDVEEDEQVVARVAGIDVAKASGTVCTRVPAESGTRAAGYQGLAGEGGHPVVAGVG